MKSGIVAVLLAAGASTRFGGKRPKQYVNIGGKPLLYYVVKTFYECDIFSEIIIVIDKEWEERVSAMLEGFSRDKTVITFLKGGITRSQSSYNAVKYLEQRKPDYVLFHDVARPFVEKKLIKRVVMATRKYGAAIAGTKTLESVASITHSQVKDSFPSRDLFIMQTPECFQFDLLLKAYKMFSQEKLFFKTATNLHLMHALKKRIFMVQHSGLNMKLTYSFDLKIAKLFLHP